MSDKGTALIVTMVYLIIVAVVCAVVLGFSSGHYRLMTQRVEKFQKTYYAEGGLYLGLFGATGQYQIYPGDNQSLVYITIPGGTQVYSQGSYNLD